MRRRATTWSGVLLIALGFASIVLPSTDVGWMLYAPYSYSVMLESETAHASPMFGGQSWAFILIGSVLITLTHASRRTALIASILYLLAIVMRLLP